MKNREENSLSTETKAYYTKVLYQTEMPHGSALTTVDKKINTGSKHTE